ncbi:hypothetical protein Tco_0632738 [Tanacetum coccineum]
MASLPGRGEYDSFERNCFSNTSVYCNHARFTDFEARGLSHHGDEHLSTIPEKESDEFIKYSVEDLVPIPSESEDTSENDSDYDLPSDDESLSDEDVPEDNVKIYSNPLFEFDDEYISSDVNPLFDEELENIESKESYVSNLDETALLVTPFFDANKDECFDPGGDIDEIDAFLDIVVSTDIVMIIRLVRDRSIIYLKSLLIKDTTPNLPPEVFLDHDLRSLKDKLDKEDLKRFALAYETCARGFGPSSTHLQSSHAL